MKKKTPAKFKKDWLKTELRPQATHLIVSTDGRNLGRKDERTEVRTDGRTDEPIIIVPFD